MNRFRPALCTRNWEFRKSLPGIIALAGQMGVQGLEIWLPHLTAQPLSQTNVLLKTHGLETVCLSAPWGCRFWEHGPALLHYAGAVRARGIKVFGDTFEAADDLPARLGEFCLQAGKAGLEVYLETHDRQPHDTVDHTLAILKAVNEKNLKVILDLYNTHEVGDDMEGAAERLRPFLGHLHIKWGFRNEGRQFVPLPVSQAPPSFKKALMLLTDYPCWYSIEHYEADKEIRDALEVMASF